VILPASARAIPGASTAPAGPAGARPASAGTLENEAHTGNSNRVGSLKCAVFQSLKTVKRL